MARLPRLSVAGWPHLLLHRGHNGSAIVLDDVDRTQLMTLLRESALANQMALHAYAVLDNELRLLATPRSADSLSKFMQALGRRYGIYFNRRHDHAGSLWEGRFRSTVIEPERHLLNCMHFVERAADPAWSSIAHHHGQRADGFVSDHLVFWKLGNTPFEREMAYRNEEERALTKEIFAEIDSAVRQTLPLGSTTFVDQLALATSRRLVALKRGRPQINKSDPN